MVGHEGSDVRGFRLVQIAHLTRADELQFGIFQPKFVHDGQRVPQVAADAVGDHAQFRHGRNSAPETSSSSLMMHWLSSWG